MATSKKDLSLAYDALSSAIQSTNEAVHFASRLPREEADKAIQMVMDAVDTQRKRGATLIALLKQASVRCGELTEMSERLIDKSTTVIGRALGI